MSADAEQEYPTPLHELCALVRAKGQHLELAIYTDDGRWKGGGRLSGTDVDPMTVVQVAVNARKLTDEDIQAMIDEEEAVEVFSGDREDIPPIEAMRNMPGMANRGEDIEGDREAPIVRRRFGDDG